MLLLVPLTLLVSSRKDVRDHNVLDRAVVAALAPPQRLLTASLDAVGQIWHRYLALVDLQQENDQLRADNAALRARSAADAEVRHENGRLRALAGLRERPPAAASIAAQIVATAPTPLFRAVRIDRGSRDGVALGAAVVTDDGVVGRVAALAAGYADVMLLVDSNSSIDVLVQRSRARARVRGQGGDDSMDMDLEYMPRTADVVPGDVLVTSGLGKSFPRGLRVGRLTAIEQRAFGLYQRGAIAPAVDFARLETVLVLLGPRAS